MQRVCGELERCRAPGGQGVVEGLIKGLLAKLPEDYLLFWRFRLFLRFLPEMAVKPQVAIRLGSVFFSYPSEWVCS